jgi:hypothetical protein
MTILTIRHVTIYRYRDLIRVAVARDPRQAMPLAGTWYGRAEAGLGMSVEVIVRRADEVGTAASY